MRLAEGPRRPVELCASLVGMLAAVSRALNMFIRLRWRASASEPARVNRANETITNLLQKEEPQASRHETTILDLSGLDLPTNRDALQSTGRRPGNEYL